MSFIVDAVKSVGSAVGSVFKAAGSVLSSVGKIAGSLINFVASPFLGLFGGAEVPSVDTGSNTPQGALVQRTGTVEDINVVYGLRKIGGLITYAETGADTNKYLWVAYALCEGAIEGLREIWINDIQVASEDIGLLNGGASVNLNPGAVKTRLAYVTTLQFWNGSYFVNPADTNVPNVLTGTVFKGAPAWTPGTETYVAGMNYNGIAAIFARYEWKEDTSDNGVDDNPFQTGGIPKLQAVVMGKKVARILAVPPEVSDPVTEDYAYGDLANGYTQSYSFNPVECLLDYLRNPRYGKGLSNDEIDWDSWRIAARKCQTPIKYFKGNGAEGTILPFNYIVGTGATLFNNVQDMLKNFRAYMPYTNGKFKLFIEDAGAYNNDITSSSYIVRQTFTKDDIQGEITYTGIERSAKYSAVTVKYVEPNEKWTQQEVTYPDTEELRQYYIDIDGGRENKHDISMNGITSYALAYDMARLIFLKNREQDSISFVGSSKAFELEVGDIIYVESNVLKFGTNPDDIEGTSPWRIVSLKLNNDYTFAISCVRHNPNIYPYTRIDEKVYKAALYVPRGNAHIKPEEPRFYLGIYPPTNAPKLGTPPGPWANYYDDSNNPPSINDPVDAQAQWLASIIQTFIDVNRVSYRSVNGQIFADIQFLQPENPMYKSATVYYKRNVVSETYWTKTEVTDKPGAGKTVAFTIGPLIKRSYIVKFFVNFTTGETQDGGLTTGANYTINPTDMVGFFEDPKEYYDIGVAGWVTAVGTAPNNLKAQPLTVTGYPILNTGVPTTPRGITLTVLQDIDTYGANNYVNGITIFYKSSGATYWKSQKFSMPTGYVAGISEPTFQIKDLGVPEYPVVPTAGQLYDFAFRYEYNDGQIAQYPNYRVNSVPVEFKAGASVGGYYFDAFQIPNLTDGTNISSALQTNIITEDNAPPGAVVSVLDMKVGVRAIEAAANPSTLRVIVQPPNPADLAALYGVKIYYRLYKPGVFTEFSTQTISPIPHTGANIPDTSYPYGKWTADIKALTIYPDQYEVVMVPIVASGGAKVEGNYAAYAKGTISNFPAIWTPLTTKQALNKIGSIPENPNPTPTVLDWKRVYTNVTKNDYSNYYYQLKIQLPDATNAVNIYRREKIASFTPTIDNQYQGLGRWERFQLVDNYAGGGAGVWGVGSIGGTNPVTSELIDGQRVLTINMRGPTGALAFNAPNRKLDIIYQPQWGSSPESASLSGNYPSATDDAGHEFIIQVGTTTYGISTNALLLPKISKGTSASTTIASTVKPTTVPVADYSDAKYTAYFNGSYKSYKRGIEAPYSQGLVVETKIKNPDGTSILYPVVTPKVY